ncbi:peptidylprolyl isomerase [Oxalobacter paraformigenes]|uniref:Chaperone SurA n=1 Tax=Oxalobacter paraformigenes TaxID=556268 RepID=C3X568_9BURK|nr:peptidylprolyl isomerase [Oxalobacter paraformigenes]EEO28354.2 hypothetical protein OFAG_01507 [Oxalobacter paraformigenes]
MFLYRLFKKQSVLNWAVTLLFGFACSTCVLAQTEKPVQAPAQAPKPVVVDAIAAVVNNDVITMGELNERIQMIESQLQKQNVNLPPRAELQKQVLEHMIVESAQMQLAKEMGLRIDDTQLDRTIARIAESKHMTVPQFQQYIERDGTSFESHREKIRSEITMQRLRDREVVNKIQINDAEVDHLLGADSQMQMPEQVRLGHILIRIPENASPEQIAEKRERAEKVLQILQSGGDFQQNAASYSDADEGLSGGDIGWRSTDRLPKIFADALVGVKPGNITGIIKSPNGFHILKVLDKRSMSTGPEPVAGAADGNAVQQIHARHILIKVNQLVSADEAKRKLLDLKQRIQNDSASFEELAKTYSNDTSASRGGDLGWIYPGDTVPEFEKALVSLQPGEISEPVETQFGFHLIQVLDKKTDDVSLERKRIAAKQALRERKIAEATEEWLRQLRDRAYVEYRLNDNKQDM